MNAIAAPPRLAEEQLWTRARAMFARAAAAIGAPARLAAIRLLTQALRRGILAWLCPLEHIARKLLFAEACALRRAEEACLKTSGPRMEIVQLPSLGLARHWAPEAQRAPFLERRAAAPLQINESEPETWAARFAFALPRDPHVVSAADAPRIRTPWEESPATAPQREPRALHEANAAFRLARRFEAVRRVLENPIPYAKRLARVLARVARRFPQAAQRYVFAPARTGDYDPADDRIGVDAMVAALARRGAFADSS